MNIKYRLLEQTEACQLNLFINTNVWYKDAHPVAKWMAFFNKWMILNQITIYPNIHMFKIKFCLFFRPTLKISSMFIVSMDSKGKIITCLQESREYFHDIWIGKSFINKIQKVLTIKKKDKLYHNKRRVPRNRNDGLSSSTIFLIL